MHKVAPEAWRQEIPKLDIGSMSNHTLSIPIEALNGSCVSISVSKSHTYHYAENISILIMFKIIWSTSLLRNGYT